VTLSCVLESLTLIIRVVDEGPGVYPTSFPDPLA